MTNENKTNPPSSEIQQKAIKWLSEKKQNKGRCEVCGQSHWFVPDQIVAHVNREGGSLQIGGGYSYPHFLNICTNCGNTKFINAMLSGVVESSKKEEKVRWKITNQFLESIPSKIKKRLQNWN